MSHRSMGHKQVSRKCREFSLRGLVNWTDSASTTSASWTLVLSLVCPDWPSLRLWRVITPHQASLSTTQPALDWMYLLYCNRQAPSLCQCLSQLCLMPSWSTFVMKIIWLYRCSTSFHITQISVFVLQSSLTTLCTNSHIFVFNGLILLVVELWRMDLSA